MLPLNARVTIWISYAIALVLHRFEVDSWSTFLGCIARGVSVPVTEAHVRDPPG